MPFVIGVPKGSGILPLQLHPFLLRVQCLYGDGCCGLSTHRLPDKGRKKNFLDGERIRAVWWERRRGKSAFPRSPRDWVKLSSDFSLQGRLSYFPSIHTYWWEWFSQPPAASALRIRLSKRLKGCNLLMIMTRFVTLNAQLLLIYTPFNHFLFVSILMDRKGCLWYLSQHPRYNS